MVGPPQKHCWSKPCTSWRVQTQRPAPVAGFTLLKRKRSLSVLVSSGWHHRRRSPCRLLSQTTSCLLSMAGSLLEEGGGVWDLRAHAVPYQIRCTSGMWGNDRLKNKLLRVYTLAVIRGGTPIRRRSHESLYRNISSFCRKHVFSGKKKLPLRSSTSWFGPNKLNIKWSFSSFYWRDETITKWSQQEV